MSSTTYFLRRFILLLLVLNCLHAVLVLGQDETTPAPNPAPEPTTREPPPEPTTRDPPPTTRQDPPTSRPEPTTRSPTDPPITSTPTTVPPSTEPPTTTPPPDGTITSSPPATSSMTVSSPQPNGPTCQQECLAGAAGTLGCANMADRACICPQLESYTNAANTCMENNNCGPAAQAIGEVQRMCQSNTMSGTPTGGPSTSPTPRNPPSPGPTVGTQGGTGVNGQLTTQTQTLVLTAGQVVTLPVSGTVQTTFTASSALTTTRIATMLEQAGFGGSGSDGASGGAMGLHVGCGMSVVVAVVGVMVGAVFVL